MLTRVWSWMTSKFRIFLRLFPFAYQQQIESFINKLLEQPFCHYQTENNIRSPTFPYISFSHHHIPRTDIHNFVPSLSLTFHAGICLSTEAVGDGKCQMKKKHKKVIKLIKPEKKSWLLYFIITLTSLSTSIAFWSFISLATSSFMNVILKAWPLKWVLGIYNVP